MMENGYGSMWMGDWLTTLICAGISVLLVGMLFRIWRNRNSSVQERRSSLEILQKKYASREIGQKEYSQRRQELEA